MGLTQAVQGAVLVTPKQFDGFRQDTVVATGFASLRHRRLPADQVIWRVVGMALMRNESPSVSPRC
jgi:hypothetical protein